MLKKFSIIVFILISIALIFMSTQKKLVPQIDMLTISGETISTAVSYTHLRAHET